MNITIIGCGYVGQAVASYCRWHLGHTVTTTTTTPERVPELETVAHRVAVLKSQEETLPQLLQNQDVIFLSVAPTGTQRVDVDHYESTYLHTAKNLTAALQNSSVKQVIYTGSCSVYGNSQGEWVNETTPAAPANSHGEILQKTEQVLLETLGNTRVCIFRLGAIYGPGREIEERFRDLAGTTRPGTGDYFTNWIHLDDIVSATEFALNHQLQGIYNLVNDIPLTAQELFERLCERYNLPSVEWDASATRSRSNNRRVSNQKLKNLGYRLIHPETEI